MKVSELIECLQTYRQNAHVVVQGYENGYDDIVAVKEVSIRPAHDPQWWDGKYEKAGAKTSERTEQAVLLFGRDRS
jgi:hypothetical protein